MFYRGRHASDAVAAMNYSPGNKISVIMKWKKRMKDRRLNHDSSEQILMVSLDTVNDPHIDFDGKRELRIIFLESSMWSAPEYRTEPYTKTTRMQLAFDDDKMYDKKIPLSLTGHPERGISCAKHNKSKIGNNTDFYLTVHSGHQTSLNNLTKQNPIKFSAAFNSKIYSGPCYLSRSFLAADISSLVIKNP